MISRTSLKLKTSALQRHCQENERISHRQGENTCKLKFNYKMIKYVESLKKIINFQGLEIMCWKTFPMDFSHQGMSCEEETVILFLYLMDSCMANSVGRQRRCFPLQERADLVQVLEDKDSAFEKKSSMLLLIMKDSGFISSWSLSYNIPTECSGFTQTSAFSCWI